MNKLTKIGASALCGSLAAISAANAGDLTVTGGIDLTYVSQEDATTGNPIGLGSNYSMKGSGELDNGWTVDLAIANGNKSAYSSTNVTIGGNSVIGSESFIGLGAQTKENLTIGSQVIIGMGAIVFKDIESGMIAMGNPARPIRRNENKKVF